ncbi:MAG TPA: HD domain-containing phosphohydrolase [Solirubrobacteraceae bacterium]|nr:HD domain-containing phosphohydrolase [Solirubrobacteraceae bacterium]
MRQLALCGLLLSVLLAGVAVFNTAESANTRRANQDRALQAAVGSETGRVEGSAREMSTAAAQMLANPAVRGLLGSMPLSPQGRSADLAYAATALASYERTAVVPLASACIDFASGRQLVCAPDAHPTIFPLALGDRFATLAAETSGGAATSTFLSPLNGRPTVAYVAPLRVGGKLLGLVHFDIDSSAAQGASLLVSVPDVRMELAGYEDGWLMLHGRALPLVRSGAGSSAGTRGEGTASGQTRWTLDQEHRSMITTLPVPIGGTRRQLAVFATYLAPDPNLLNAWSAGRLAVLALALAMLIGSVAALVTANRRMLRELATDPLTRLRNRRALMEELPRVCQRATEEQPAFLWFFDLNGFKSYNDSFGHLAGDALLTRLGNRLQDSVRPFGSVYRLGGDEFCALVSAPVSNPLALFHQARQALAEHGGAFAVTASAGAVEIPRETSDPTHALRLADQHMYRDKAASRGGAAELVTAVLHAALAQRHPELDEHSSDVAGDVELLARTIGLEEDLVEMIIRAGDLHDVGKLGIPDEIIAKPGPLSEREWELMRLHTVMGERIIAAAGPSLERIAPLVRASHERWDGQGYPDGLAGEQIPLGARIITICDSFRAMLSERPYKKPMSLPDALAELRRCAGSQFDPRLVEVFCTIVAEQSAFDRHRSAAG